MEIYTMWWLIVAFLVWATIEIMITSKKKSKIKDFINGLFVESKRDVIGEWKEKYKKKENRKDQVTFGSFIMGNIIIALVSMVATGILTGITWIFINQIKGMIIFLSGIAAILILVYLKNLVYKRFISSNPEFTPVKEDKKEEK